MADKVLKARLLLRNDLTANWNADTVLLKGEAGVEFTADGKTKIKVGDGTTKWSELPYVGGADLAGTQVFQVEPTAEASDGDAITTAVGEAKLQAGDMAIVKRVISGEKYEYTAYVYNGTAWCAMDGNYNAENVYFDEDLITTSAIGNVVLTNGQGTISSTGKNLKEVWNQIFVKAKNPTITKPSAKITLTGAGSYEVGTVLPVSYSTSYDAGKYEYGPATGCSAQSYSITNSNGTEVATEASGSLGNLQVVDGTNEKYSVVVKYSQGAIPKNNLGEEVASSRISAGSTTKATSSAITGYRNSFYGTSADKVDLTSDIIRGLNKSGKALANGSTFTITIPTGAVRVIFAYPATLRDVSSVKDVNGLNAEVSSAFSMTTMQIKGAEGYNAIDYKVYGTEFAEPVAKANSYTVVI